MSTVLLLHLDGPNGSTTFPDSSLSAHTVTAGGAAQISNAQAKFGTTSCIFDGSGDYLIADGGSDFNFASGNYTVDFWAWLNASIDFANFPSLYDFRDGTFTNGSSLIFGPAAQLLLFDNGSQIVTGASAVTTGAWHHIAVARSGSNTRLFLDGVQEGSTATTLNSLDVGANRPAIGIGSGLSGVGFFGHIDEFRILKGEAAWTAGFTPPSTPYVIATSVLFAQACM